MGSFDTKLLIADSLIELARERPLAKISVSDIVAKSDKNRKTFYYHFTDKDHLVAWIFRHDVSTLLERAVPAHQLVYSDDGDRACDEFPFYTRIKDGVRTMDGRAFLQVIAQAAEARREFYVQALADSSPNCLTSYLRRLYVPALQADVELILSNRTLDERQRRFLAEFYFEAVLGYVKAKLSDRAGGEVLGDFGPFANIVHASISDAITHYQQERALGRSTA